MSSIRRRLLTDLLIGMVLIASGTGVLIYRHVHNELDELYNANIKQLAKYMVHEWEDFKPPVEDRRLSKNRPLKTQWEEEDFMLQLWDRDGTPLYQYIPAKTTANIPLYQRSGFHRIRFGSAMWRIYRVDGPHVIVQIAQPESARRDTIAETSAQLLIPLLLQIPLLILVAWLSVRHGLRPLQSLSRHIARKRPESLTAIDSSEQPQELQPLVLTLNDLLQRLDTALEQQRRFVADAAHELRTPIASLQLQLDLLQRADDHTEQEQAIAQLRTGMQRTTHLARQLLSIAGAESATANQTRETIDLTTTVRDMVERHLPAARAAQLDLGVAKLESAYIDCNRADIETVLDNLVSNAIRYTPAGGHIDISVHTDNDSAVIEVQDSGPGIHPQHRSLVFNRFYRVLENPAADHHIEGSGLGLAIVKAICDRYQASIEIADGDQINEGDNGQGTRFILRWPPSLTDKY